MAESTALRSCLRERHEGPREDQDGADTAALHAGLPRDGARHARRLGKAGIPFLKRTGFLATDGTPTDLYRRFRNSGQVGAAAAEALQHGYKPLYAANEYVHNAKDADVKGLVVQITGAEEDSKQVQAIVGSFKNLRAYADFSSVLAPVGDAEPGANTATGR